VTVQRGVNSWWACHYFVLKLIAGEDANWSNDMISTCKYKKADARMHSHDATSEGVSLVILARYLLYMQS